MQKVRCDRFSIFKPELCKFWSNFESDRKIVDGTGARTPSNHRTDSCVTVREGCVCVCVCVWGGGGACLDPQYHIGGARPGARPNTNLEIVMLARALLHCDNKIRQICLDYDYNVTFSFYPLNVTIIRLKCEYGARSKNPFTCYPRCYTTWCSLTTETFASQCLLSRDALLVTVLHTFDIGLFKWGKSYSTSKLNHVSKRGLSGP